MKRTLNRETIELVDESVKLNGWVHARRNMGKVVFLDMRDRTGLLQVVLVPAELDDASNEILETIRPEFVLEIDGVVQARGEKQKNDNLETGSVEVLAKSVKILNTSETPPFEIDKDTSGINEELRLKYRYLDLRSERMTQHMRMRDKLTTFFRDYMHENDFVEIETPILMKGTPEGSREYVVPSRLHEGEFYVLPQSPQQFKQLLMVAGFERYFQLAHCMRDEDSRADRNAEFVQLDYEMSFVTQEEVLSFTEEMFIEMVERLFPNKKLSSNPFVRLTYAEAMEKYGTDKPDLRENKDDPDELAFCWVVDFPMFETLEDGSIQAMHHPFCSVHPDDRDKLESDPMSVRANAYDLVLNGYELSSGSIRIHERELQEQIFEILGISKEEQEQKFGHMLEAFTYGAPPHGGFAPGIDRMLMPLLGETSIREVIAFPKTGDARDMMMNAPSKLPKEVLKEVHIKVDESE